MVVRLLYLITGAGKWSLELASSIGVVLILLGGFLMALGYGMVSDCLSRFQSNYCWNPVSRGSAGVGAFGLYLGAILVTLAVIILAGRDIVRLFGNLSGAGSSSQG